MLVADDRRREAFDPHTADNRWWPQHTAMSCLVADASRRRHHATPEDTGGPAGFGGLMLTGCPDRVRPLSASTRTVMPSIATSPLGA